MWRCSIVWLALLAVGCAAPTTVTLRNGVVEAEIVPGIGRVMAFRRVGGPNVLLDHRPTPRDVYGWTDHGGDKLWPWPQDDWVRRTGKEWPPPPAADHGPYVLSRHGRGVELRGPMIAGYGARFVRRIELTPSRAELVSTAWLESADGRIIDTAAAWEVMQVARVGTIDAIRRDGATIGIRSIGDVDFFAGGGRLDPRSPGLLRLVLPRPVADKSGKLGLDVDALSIATRAGQLTVESASPPTPMRAQVFYAAAYAELEHTAPPGTRLIVVWRLD